MRRKRTYDAGADKILQDFGTLPCGRRVRHMETSAGIVLDIRQYISSETFEGFTQKGVRLSMSGLAQLRGILDEILEGEATSPQIDAEPVAPPETPEPVPVQATLLPEPATEPEQEPRTVTRYRVIDRTPAGYGPEPEPAPAPAPRPKGKALTPAEYAARLLGK